MLFRSYAKQWQEEAIKDVEAKKPRYFIFVNHPLSWMMAPDGEATFFKWTQSYMPANYKVVYVADQYSPGDVTNYVEGNQTATYQIKGNQFILVWERITK